MLAALNGERDVLRRQDDVLAAHHPQLVQLRVDRVAQRGVEVSGTEGVDQHRHGVEQPARGPRGRPPNTRHLHGDLGVVVEGDGPL